MLQKFFIASMLALVASLFFLQASEQDANGVDNSGGVTFFSNFESASLGQVDFGSFKIKKELVISLKADNNDLDLPETFKSWFYFGIKTDPIKEPIVLRITKRGWPYFYNPVYSIDNKKTWLYFDDSEVSYADQEKCNLKEFPVSSACDIIIKTKKLSGKLAYVARFIPYTHTDWLKYLQVLLVKDGQFITSKDIGTTKIHNKNIQLITIRDPSTVQQKAIWIHARTHPGETASSYGLEGMINQFIKDLRNGKPLARNIVFYIVPVMNIDGVIDGNYRTTPKSIELERQWYHNEDNPLTLDGAAASENKYLNAEMKQLIQDGNPPKIALNLHSTNAPKDAPAFTFLHFGKDDEKYKYQRTNNQQRLQQNTNAFVDFINGSPYYTNNNSNKFFTAEFGSKGFLNSYFPETWWWRNVQNKTLALTIEFVYGKAANNWITAYDLRSLGGSITEAMYKYIDFLTKNKKAQDISQ